MTPPREAKVAVTPRSKRRSPVAVGSLRAFAWRGALSFAFLAMAQVSTAHVERRAGWATGGMVVSDCPLASEAGAEVLRSGGNAIDAAVATAFTLAVTFPWAGNLGGGGFAVVHLADGRDIALDFREVAPAAAHRDLFLDERGEVVSGLSLESHLAVGVPGSVEGLLRLHRDHGSGRISPDEILAPAIRLARDGFPLSDDLAARLRSKRAHLSRDEDARGIFVRADGREWLPGDLLVQTDLAATLEEIALHGAEGFYAGRVAELWVAEFAAHGGIQTAADLAAYESLYREPLRGEFYGHTIVSMPPPSSGGLIVLQMLAMLERFPLNDLQWGSAPYLHLLTEVARRSYADRSVHLGDPDQWPVPSDALLAPAYIEERAGTISMQRATPSTEVRPGGPFPAAPGAIPSPSTGVKNDQGERREPDTKREPDTRREPDETTHLVAIDSQGNAVSLTTTLNTGFGSGLVAGGTGVLLNNEMDDFSAKPGVPNTYGLVGNEANAIAPGKRMLSSMSPTVVLRDGRPVLVVGSPGGSRIITSVVQVILNHLVFGMPVAEAVAVPRIHAQWLPDLLYYEPRGLSPETIAALEARGHVVTIFPERAIGRVHAIEVRDDGIHAGPDVRGGGAAAGVARR